MAPFTRPTFKPIPLCLAACLAGCLSGPEHGRRSDPPADQKPAQAPLVMKLAKGLGKRAAGSVAAETEFFLDTAAGSFFQYFFLENRSDKPVRNIRIRTSNRQLQFIPAQIASLEPSASVNFEQILKLAVIHGTRLNAFGYDSVLPKGMNRIEGSIEYTVPGTDGDTARLSLPFTLSVFAKLVDVDLVVGGRSVDLRRPFAFSQSSLSPEPYPVYAGNGMEALLRNTGNVELRVKTWDGNGQGLSEETVLPPEGSMPVPAEAGLAIDGAGVTSDLGKLPVNKNGKYFLGLMQAPGDDPLPDPKL